MRFLIIIATILFSFLIRTTNSFSTGAAGCEGSGTAVMGAHTDVSANKTVSDYTIEEKGVKFLIGGMAPVNGKFIGLRPGVSYEIRIETPNFKGLLLRVEAPPGVETIGVLEPDLLTRVANSCVNPIVGITHTSAIDKQYSTGYISFPSETLGVLIDLNIVYYNSDTSSEYAYSQFTADFANIAPTQAPGSTNTACGILGLSILCFNGCGFFGRLLGLCQ